MTTKLKWDVTGERLYETGVENGVLYVQSEGVYGEGVAWNGLVSISENPTGAEPNAFYADNIKYLNLMSIEEFEASIEAYTYPNEFGVCDGSAEVIPGVMLGQQPRSTFGLAYKTRIGNDVDADKYGYKLHLVYGALASPSEKSYETISDTPEPITFSWDITTTPVESGEGNKPTASLTIDSTKVDAGKLKTFEDVLFGSDSEAARLPLPAEVLTLLGEV